jgi:hypothetical protein
MIIAAHPVKERRKIQAAVIRVRRLVERFHKLEAQNL